MFYQLHVLLSLHTLSDHSLAYSLYARVVGEREREVSYDSVTVLRYGGFDVSCLLT